MGFTGTAPDSGAVGLLVTDEDTTPDELVESFRAAGRTVEALAVLERGAWRMYWA